MIWNILIESDGDFISTLAAFFGTTEEVSAHLEILQADTGICHAAELAQ